MGIVRCATAAAASTASVALAEQAAVADTEGAVRRCLLRS